MQLKRQVVSTTTYEILKDILNNIAFREFYLVGGTAISLLLGHRQSLDLDFFSQQEFRSNLVHQLPPDKKIMTLSDNSIEIVAEKTKITLMYFAFPLYKEVLIIDGIRIADPIDLGLMKLLALQGRSTRKDIIDLYFLDKEVIRLEKLLEIFETYYPNESFNSYGSLKSLFDIEFLKSEPMPAMLQDVEWESVLETVQAKIAQHLRTKIDH